MAIPMDKRRILLVDDEVAFAQVLKLYLEHTGCYEVALAHNGTDGLAAAKADLPQLILLDVIMPDVSGGEVAQQLKADDRTHRIPVIFLTAVVSREEALARAGMIGGQLFLAKPVSAKEVLASIDRYLGNGAEAVMPS